MTQEQCTSGKTAPCCLVSSHALSDGHLCAQHKWGPARTPASHLGYPWVEQDGFESHSLEMLRCLFLKGSITHGTTGALLLRQCFPLPVSARQRRNGHIGVENLPRQGMLLAIWTPCQWLSHPREASRSLCWKERWGKGCPCAFSLILLLQF